MWVDQKLAESFFVGLALLASADFMSLASAIVLWKLNSISPFLRRIFLAFLKKKNGAKTLWGKPNLFCQASAMSFENLEVHASILEKFVAKKMFHCFISLIVVQTVAAESSRASKLPETKPAQLLGGFTKVFWTFHNPAATQTDQQCNHSHRPTCAHVQHGILAHMGFSPTAVLALYLPLLCAPLPRRPSSPAVPKATSPSSGRSSSRP